MESIDIVLRRLSSCGEVSAADIDILGRLVVLILLEHIAYHVGGEKVCQTYLFKSDD